MGICRTGDCVGLTGGLGCRGEREPVETGVTLGDAPVLSVAVSCGVMDAVRERDTLAEGVALGILVADAVCVRVVVRVDDVVWEALDVCEDVRVPVVERVGVFEGVPLLDGVSDGVREGEGVSELVSVLLGVSVDVSLAEPLDELLEDGELVWLGLVVPEYDAVDVTLAVTVGVPVSAPVLLEEPELEEDAVFVGDGVPVTFGVDVVVGVPVPVAVCVFVPVATGEPLRVGELLGVTDGVGELDLVTDRVMCAVTDWLMLGVWLDDGVFELVLEGVRVAEEE